MSLSCAVVLSTVAAALAAAACPPEPADAPRDWVLIRTENTWAMLASPADRVVDSNIGRRSRGAGDDDGGLAGQSPSDVGAWAAPIPFPVVAIHASLLHTGEVLAYGYPGQHQAKVWNPQTGAFTAVNMPDDIFCSGHAQLADGRVYVAGGNQSGCKFKGIVDTNIFDPATRTWTPLENMIDGRWYPTVLTLPDGRALIFAGLGLDCDDNPIVELFTPGAGLSIVAEGERQIDLYPRMHILSNGRIAHVGTENSAWTFQVGQGWQFVDWNNFGWRDQGTSVLLPGFTDRVMIIGGSSVTNTCEIIDFTQPAPQWTYTTPMHHARRHADATILPDKTVLVMGGGQSGLYASPVLTPELYDPVSATWTLLPSHVYGRAYHSTTVLLPDGRVLVAGQDNGPGAQTAEIYSPAYLFRGPRPTIDSIPAHVAYGQAFTINTPDADAVDSVVLIRLANVTHSVTFDQRLVELPFATGGAGEGRGGEGATTLIATAPPTANHAPPGYYMLFALDADGVPSVAKMIRAGVDPTADINGSGSVDVDDLIAIILGWGPCAAPCAADIDTSGAVDVDDLIAVILGWSTA